MSSSNTSKPIGVIGAGSFGTAVANLLAVNSEKVLLLVRSQEKAERIRKERKSAGQDLSDKIEIATDVLTIGERCDVIFPIVPSSNFRAMIQEASPSLRPSHILIHGTKGFDLNLPKKYRTGSFEEDIRSEFLAKEHVRTMSELILEETSVVRVGCMAGPNLAKEISEHKPAATVIASPFEEVIRQGEKLLRNDRFLVYGSQDLLGTELCGILKNIIAVGAGILQGLNLGENARALLISRGLVEMIYIGKALGGNVEAFLGLAGVGDLVATAGSTLSRNFTVGNRLAKGESIKDIIQSMEEVAEGVKTVQLVMALAKKYNLKCVITELLHKVLNEEISVEDAQVILMKMPFQQEVDFLD